MYLTDRPRPDRVDESGSGHPVGPRVATTVVLLGLVSMFTDISSEAVSAVLPIYLTAVVGLGPLAYGFVDAIYQGVSALVRLLGGWTADHADRPKAIALLGYGASAVTKVLLIVATGFGVIAAVIGLDRLGKGIRTAPRDALIAASSPPQSLGRAFGVHRALDTLGAVIGPLVAFVVLWVVPGDFRGVFVAAFAAALIGLAILVLFVPDLRPRRAARRSGLAEPLTKPLPRPALALLRGRRFARVAGAAGLLGVLTVGDGFLYLALHERDNVATEYFPLLYVGTGLAYLALAVPFGRLADRIGRPKVFVAGHLAIVVAYACAAGPVGGLAATIGCLAGLGIYYAATDGVLAALTARLAPVEIRASAIATTQTVVAGARFVSSLGFGVLWTLVGQQPALLAVGVLLLVALPFAWQLVRTAEEPATEQS